MYLEQAAIEKLLETLHRVFPRHKLICDLMTRAFFEKNARTIHEKLTGMGAVFKFTIDNPEEVFLKNGYRQIDKIPIVEKSVQFSMPRLPEFVWKALRRMLPHGYSIHVFETV